MSSHKIKTIEVSNLTDAVADILKGYSEDIKNAVEVELTKMGNEGMQELRQTKQPKETNPGTSNKSKRKEWNKYSKGWKTKVDKDKKDKIDVVIYNSTKPHLTSLLEYGHATRNGGRTRAFAHIKPLEQKLEEESEERIKKAIEGLK